MRNLPSEAALASTRDALLQLPVFPNWAGEFMAAGAALGSCSGSLLERVACEAVHLPPAIQVGLLSDKAVNAYAACELKGAENVDTRECRVRCWTRAVARRPCCRGWRWRP